MYQLLQVETDRLVFSNPDGSKFSSALYNTIQGVLKKHYLVARDYEGDNRSQTVTVYLRDEIEEDLMEEIWMQQ